MSQPDLAAAYGLAPMALPPLPAQPLVSVLISCYNYGAFLGAALESVLAQTYGHLEVIVVDDGSTDDSVAVAEAVAARDPRVRVVVQANGGQAAAINAGVAESRGEVLFLMDADDLFEPAKVAAVLDLFRAAPRAGFAVHRVVPVDAENRPILRDLVPWPLAQGWCAPEALRAGGGAGRFPPSSALTLRREVALHLAPLDVRLRGAADGLWQRLAPLATEIVASPEPLTRYRCHGRNLGHAAFETLENIAQRLRDLELLRDASVTFAARAYGPQVAAALAADGADAALLATHAWLALIGDATPAERRRTAAAMLAHPEGETVAFRTVYRITTVWPALGAALLRTAVTDNPLKRAVAWTRARRAALRSA